MVGISGAYSNVDSFKGQYQESIVNYGFRCNSSSRKTKMLKVLLYTAVGDYVSGKWPKLGKGRSSSTSSADGYRSGRNVGKNMSIRKGVGGSKTSYGGMLGNGK